MKSIFHSSPRSRRLRQSPSPESQEEMQPFFANSDGLSDAQNKSQPFFQAKLTVGAPDDPYEREADAVANKVVSGNSNGAPVVQSKEISTVQRLATPNEEKMPGTNDARMEEDRAIQEKPEAGAEVEKEMPVQKMDAPEEEDKTIQEKPEEEPEKLQTKAESGKGSKQANLGSRLSQSRGNGEPLSAPVRAEMEQGIGADFSGVRIHRDSESIGMNKDLHAQAFTHGQDVFFNSGKFNPENTEGKRLLAHELTHVVQQGGKFGNIRRKPSYLLPNKSEDLNIYTDEQLKQLYLELTEEINAMTQCDDEMVALTTRAENVLTTLRTRASAAGRTFSDASIQGAKQYFEANAKKTKAQGRDECITAVNNGLKMLTGNAKLPTTPETMEASMGKVDKEGYVSEKAEFRFNNKKGKITTGSTRPETLQYSVWDTVIHLSGGDVGWSVFGLSLMDGNHSVTLTLDNNRPEAPKIYWSDQWDSKGGWKEYDRAGLDTEVLTLIQKWWDKQPPERKFDTVVRLWRIRSTKQP